ncbi:uncharacterized protein [Antedon mediterranea]|uniref:uncharacterized protein n=1 Tax=Antedon mediterranea TaxID=105859 RepID=UPI003AF42D2F
MASKASLRDVQRTVDELRAELEATRRAAHGNGNTVYVLPEKKMRHFVGAEGECVESFVEDIKAAIKVRKLRGQNAADFVVSHLEGAARREIRHRPRVADDSELILRTLQDTFGERMSLNTIMRQIYNAIQKRGQSISDYAFVLLGFSEKLGRIPNAPDPERTIRDQFCEGLADSVLRRELKKMLKDDPGVTFFRLRDWAMDMEEEDGLHRKPVKAYSYVTEADDQILKTLENLSLAVKMQTEITEDIRNKQEEFTNRLEKLENQSKERTQRKSTRRDKSTVQCHRCKQMGHYASECPSPCVVSSSEN